VRYLPNVATTEPATVNTAPCPFVVLQFRMLTNTPATTPCAQTEVAAKAKADSDWDIAPQWSTQLDWLGVLGLTETLRRNLPDAVHTTPDASDLIAPRHHRAISMSITTILAQIALGEDSTHQFKVDVRNGESLAAEMVAFANSNGGTVMIGVADDGSTPGLVSYVAKGLPPYHGLGSGIKRALSSWPDIEFSDDRDGCLFLATIHRKLVAQNEGANEGVSALLNLITRNPGMRAPSMADALKTSPKNVDRWLKQLKENGWITFQGATKTGGYHATPKQD